MRMRMAMHGMHRRGSVPAMHGMHRRGSVPAMHGGAVFWRGSVPAMHGGAVFWRGSVPAMHGGAVFWRGNVPGVHAILQLGVTRWVKSGSRSRLGPRATLAPREPRIRYYRGFSLLQRRWASEDHVR